MDKVSKEVRSSIMSQIKSKDSVIEIKFRKSLWRSGFRYRKNPANYLGKPDIVLNKYKTVIFVDSCFWHGCKKHCRFPKSRKAYWISKILRNIKRDKEVNSFYKKQNWKVVRIWEHNINDKFIEKINKKLKNELFPK